MEKARELRAQGLSFAKIGKKLGVSGDVIRKRLSKKTT
jgi:transposase